MVIAFLDVGPTEFLLIAGLLLVLFGADKLPDMARELGRVRARIAGAASDFTAQLDAERQGFVPGDAVPRAQKEQLAQAEQNELARLQRAAQALGIDIIGKDEAQLRREVAERVGEA